MTLGWSAGNCWTTGRFAALLTTLLLGTMIDKEADRRGMSWQELVDQLRTEANQNPPTAYHPVDRMRAGREGRSSTGQSSEHERRPAGGATSPDT